MQGKFSSWERETKNCYVETFAFFILRDYPLLYSPSYIKQNMKTLDTDSLIKVSKLFKPTMCACVCY